MDKNETINRLSIKNLFVNYGNSCIINNISLDVQPSEILAVIGESGCGKSTLLQSIAGFVPVSMGSIFLNNQEYIKDGLFSYEEWEVRKNVILVFQEYNLIPHFKCIDNIISGLIYVKKYNKSKSIELANEIADRLGIRNILNKYPYETSGGEKQRVALARAVIMQPQVLLLDEITSAIDPITINKVGKLIGEIKTSNEIQMSMILVTHNMKFARDYCDRIAFIHQGIFKEIGSPECIFDLPQTRELQLFINESKYLL
jgi:polar amino acid transport system ATP-binding protein